MKFSQASSPCKRVTEAAKLVHASKTKESITSLKLRSRKFWPIAMSALNKGKFSIPPLFKGSEMSPTSDKAKNFLFAKKFF